MSNEDLYHEMICSTSDSWLLHKEEQERNDYINYMSERSKELKLIPCPLCNSLSLEPTGMFYSFCNKCKSTIKK